MAHNVAFSMTSLSWEKCRFKKRREERREERRERRERKPGAEETKKQICVTALGPRRTDRNGA